MIYGWISPDGEYLSCEFMGHYDLACEIIDANGYRIIWGDKNKPVDDVLVEHYGWIKAYHSMFDRKHTHLYMPHRLSEPQKKLLREDYFNYPENWDRFGRTLLEEYDVIDCTYDERGMCI